MEFLLIPPPVIFTPSFSTIPPYSNGLLCLLMEEAPGLHMHNFCVGKCINLGWSSLPTNAFWDWVVIVCKIKKNTNQQVHRWGICKNFKTRCKEKHLKEHRQSCQQALLQKKTLEHRHLCTTFVPKIKEKRKHHIRRKGCCSKVTQLTQNISQVTLYGVYYPHWTREETVALKAVDKSYMP